MDLRSSRRSCERDSRVSGEDSAARIVSVLLVARDGEGDSLL